MPANPISMLVSVNAVAYFLFFVKFWSWIQKNVWPEEQIGIFIFSYQLFNRQEHNMLKKERIHQILI